MIRIKEAIVVEGRYDKNTLSQLVDTLIVETRGFGIFSDKERLRFLRRIAESRGLIVFTDPDGAGMVIRRYLKGAIPEGMVKHAFIPDVYGKERRKDKGSKEGKLGVEGMTPEVLLEALTRCGATIEGMDVPVPDKITKADLFAWGLSGTPDSASRRERLYQMLSLPSRLTANGLIDAVGSLYTKEELEKAVERLNARDKEKEVRNRE